MLICLVDVSGSQVEQLEFCQGPVTCCKTPVLLQPHGACTSACRAGESGCEVVYSFLKVQLELEVVLLFALALKIPCELHEWLLQLIPLPLTLIQLVLAVVVVVVVVEVVCQVVVNQVEVQSTVGQV